MDWINIALIVVAGVQLGLGVLIFFQNPKNKINIFFSLAVFSVSVWVFFTAMFRIVSTVELATELCRVKLIMGLLIAIFFQIFTLFFPYKKKKINLLSQLLIILPSVVAVMFLIFHPQYAVNQVILKQGSNLIIVNKTFWLLYSFGFLLNFVVAIIRLFVCRKNQVGFLRTQLNFVIIAVLVPLVFSSFFNIFFLFWDIFINDWIGAFLTVIFSFVMYYFIFSSATRVKELS